MDKVDLARKAAWYASNRDDLICALSDATKSTLIEMGESAKCLSWFCSRSEHYIAQRPKDAA